MTASTILLASHIQLFDLQAVSVRFGRTEALKNVDLQVLQGQRLALIGSNGSGKSTLLRVLNGLITPKSSQKSGHMLGTLQTDAKLRQAMLFQRPHMLRTSVLANVAMGLWLGGVRWLRMSSLVKGGSMMRFCGAKITSSRISFRTR